jgi:Arc/MetJ family transcription regulator
MMKTLEDIRPHGGAAVTKRLVEINDDDLRIAQELLKVSTIKETVALALKEVIALDARRKHIELLRSGYMEPMADKEERRRAWGQ